MVKWLAPVAKSFTPPLNIYSQSGSITEIISLSFGRIN